MKCKTVDWETVGVDYRAGKKSLRLLGMEHDVSHVAVKKKADKEGWLKDLPARIKIVAGTQFAKKDAGNQSVNHEQAGRCRVGAPSIKTPELLEAICDAICSGKSARAACNEVGISQRVLWEWLAADRAFAQQYAWAKQWCVQSLIDEIIEIADDSSGDTYIDKKGRRVANHAFIARARLRINARKWYISRLMPRKYGEYFLGSVEKDAAPVPRIQIVFVGASQEKS